MASDPTNGKNYRSYGAFHSGQKAASLFDAAFSKPYVVSNNSAWIIETQSRETDFEGKSNASRIFWTSKFQRSSN